MANEELIANLNLTKQRINEGSLAVRNQIDQNVLPLCGEDQTLLGYVKGARREFTEGDQAAKKEIDNAILYVNQPVHPVDVLPEELSYWKTEEWIAPFFIPTLLFHSQINRNDATWFANRQARNHHGNVQRFFAFGTYEPYWKDRRWAIMPFPMNDNGKYDVSKYVQLYWDELFFRIEEFTKRNITVFIDLIDNVAIHDKVDGFWMDHPWNGRNNVNGTSTWNNMLYHYYEQEHQSKPGWKETGELSQKFYRDLVSRTFSRFAGRIGYGAGNEVHARTNWHKIMRDIVRESAPGIDRKFMITSMSEPSFYSVKIHEDWIYSVHGGCTAANKSYSKAGYNRKAKILPDEPTAQRSIFSEDGCHPTLTLQPTEDIVYQIMKDGRAGFEQNLRPLLIKQKKPDGTWEWHSLYKEPAEIDWTLRSIDYAFAEAVKIGWMRFRNDPN